MNDYEGEVKIQVEFLNDIFLDFDTMKDREQHCSFSNSFLEIRWEPCAFHQCH